MARKLKGRASSKGLKASLLKHKADARLIKKQHSQRGKDSQTFKPQSGKKLGKQAERQRAKQVSFVPFDPDETLLLVGEGDFSFARAIVAANYIKPENLVATSYDASPRELELKYPHSFTENYKFLMDHGVKVFFKVDATNLIQSLKISKHTPWKRIVGEGLENKPLQNIMFNFPHTGRGIKDQDRNIKEHQELVLGYFQSGKKLLNLINSEVGKEAMHSIQGYAVSPDEKSVGGRDNCGKIIISIFTGEPYDSWEVKYLARENGLKLERSSKFYWENYPGYRHRRTNSEQNTTKPAAEREARVYIFKSG